MTRTQPAVGRIGLVALLTLTFWAGMSLGPPQMAEGENRVATPRQAFLAGDERSLPILEEISATLRQIDGRLARLEKIAAEAARKDRQLP